MHFAARLKVNVSRSDRLRKVYGPLYYNVNGNQKSTVGCVRNSAHDEFLTLALGYHIKLSLK